MIGLWSMLKVADDWIMTLLLIQNLDLGQYEDEEGEPSGLTIFSRTPEEQRCRGHFFAEGADETPTSSSVWSIGWLADFLLKTIRCFREEDQVLKNLLTELERHKGI